MAQSFSKLLQFSIVGLASSALFCAAVPQAVAATITFKATLSGSAESPGNASPGTGLAIVTFDDTTSLLTVNVTFSGLQGTTTASHIHCCTSVAGVGNAGVATETPTFSALPLGVSSGNFTEGFSLLTAASYNAPFISANGGTVTAAMAALLAGLNSGSAYLNVHTSSFPAGEIRGFLLADKGSDTDVPLPASLVLFASALGSMTGTRRVWGHKI